MHLDPVMPQLVGSILGILFIGLLFSWLKQPSVIGYLLAGILMGPYGLNLIEDQAVISSLGDFGVVLLLFFIGMESSPQKLAKAWRLSLFGTLLQVMISVVSVWMLGLWLGWPLSRIVLIGFVISLSSTAVVLKLLQDRGELNSQAGQNALGILLTQDLIVIPMLIIISLFGEQELSTHSLFLQLSGSVILGGVLIVIFLKKDFSIPLPKSLLANHEMQIFAALAICFGMSLITGLLELSAALGAFIGGIIISAARQTQWVHNKLEPFHVVFVALFFVSIGMLADLHFLREHFTLILTLVLLVMITNTFINAITLSALGLSWRESVYTGALLSQIGEFSFVLAAVGLNAAIITWQGYQIVIEVIALSLLISPLWIFMSRKITFQRKLGNKES